MRVTYPNLTGDYVRLASVEVDGVRYDLVSRAVDPASLDALAGGVLMQEPKIVATKADS